MFKHMDDDESGRIQYTELVNGLRSVLRLSKAEMPESRLRSLWVHLDYDASGFLTTGEFGRFMRRGEAEGELARLAAAKQRAQRLNAVQALPNLRVRQGRAEEREDFASPLRKMENAQLRLNAELELVAPAGDAEVVRLAMMLNVQLMSNAATRALGWFKFFNVRPLHLPRHHRSHSCRRRCHRAIQLGA